MLILCTSISTYSTITSSYYKNYSSDYHLFAILRCQNITHCHYSMCQEICVPTWHCTWRKVIFYGSSYKYDLIPYCGRYQGEPISFVAMIKYCLVDGTQSPSQWLPFLFSFVTIITRHEKQTFGLDSGYFTTIYWWKRYDRNIYFNIFNFQGEKLILLFSLTRLMNVSWIHNLSILRPALHT